MSAQVSGPDGDSSQAAGGFGDLTQVANNQGFNVSAMPPTDTNYTNYTVSLEVDYPALRLTDLQVLSPNPYPCVAIVEGDPGRPIALGDVTWQLDGNVELSFTPPVPGTYYVNLGLPYSPLWQISTNGDDVGLLPQVSTATISSLIVLGTSPMSPVEVSLEFNVGLDYGLYAAFGELASLAIIAGVITFRRWRSR